MHYRVRAYVVSSILVVLLSISRVSGRIDNGQSCTAEYDEWRERELRSTGATKFIRRILVLPLRFKIGRSLGVEQVTFYLLAY